MPKILIVTQRLSPIPGVGKNRIENIINSLSSDYNVDILILKSNYEPSTIKNYFKNLQNVYRFMYPEIYYNLDDSIRSKTYTLKFLRLIYNKTLRWKFLNIYKLLFRFFIKKSLKNNNYDLLISTSPHPIVNIYAEIISEILNIKWIADVRDPFDKYNLKECGYRAIKAADLITTTTKTLRQIIEKQTNSNNISILPNGHDLKKSSIINLNNNELTTETINIFYGGSVQSAYRVHILKKLINLLMFDDRVKFYLATSVPLFKNEYSNKIINLGYLTQKNYLFYIANCDYCINITEPEDKYAIPYKVYEILGLNKKIISAASQDGEVNKILELDKNKHILLNNNFDEFDHTALQKSTDYKIIDKYSFEMLNLEIYFNQDL